MAASQPDPSDVRALDPRNWRHFYRDRYELALFQYHNSETGETSVYWDAEDSPFDWADPNNHPYNSSQYGQIFDKTPCCGVSVNLFDLNSPEAKAAIQALHDAGQRDGRTYRIYRHRFLSGPLRGCQYMPNGRERPQQGGVQQ
eukprot:TRINITY_DN18512_c0_g4_i1.p1 TRINITY_DN18512_c0_g4~~TRINITY_DN18512_c0_g4_i1.p1  ORF type:complete len:143 (-),score=16.41 TRINITY_DN18512_c0_g4_i1:222-650(-)